MAVVNIHHAHSMGLAEARRVAADWMAQADQRWGLGCRNVAGEVHDRVEFSRIGLSGSLLVAGDHFALQLQLGFLLRVYQSRIEAEIRRNLSTLSAGA